MILNVIWISMIICVIPLEPVVQQSNQFYQILYDIFLQKKSNDVKFVLCEN